jgi:recombination protein RecA
MTDAERRKATDQALVAVDRQFGKGTVLRLGADNAVPVAVISSGCLSLDVALGVGGFPRGSVIEVFGPGSSGKTTIALEITTGLIQCGAIDVVVVDSVLLWFPRLN